MEISGLSGYFDGFNWNEGPYTIIISNGIIQSIEKETSTFVDIKGDGLFLAPPFVDGHTHLIFAGDRSFELALKIGGASYAEILESGGGILYTVKFTREANDKELLDLLIGRLDLMLINGTSMVEIKSGYGLEAEEELRQLRIIKKANNIHPVEIIPTYCGAHALPAGRSRENYVNEVISILPDIKRENLATTTDVFCDRGAFNIEETEKIFKASLDVGIPVRVHAEELEYTGIGKIAAEKFQALSVDHLLLSKIDDFKVYEENNTTAMFMPAATIGLFTTSRPRGWENSKVNIGIGTDYNPNNLLTSMQIATRLAVFLYRMDPQRAFQASTSGSYQGLTGEKFNKIEEGSPATFNIINSEDINQFITRFDQNLVSHTFIEGKKITDI